MKSAEGVSFDKAEMQMSKEPYLESDDTVIHQNKVNPMYGGKVFNNVVSLQVKNNLELNPQERFVLMLEGMEEQNFCERVFIEKLEKRALHVEKENEILKEHLSDILAKKGV